MASGRAVVELRCGRLRGGCAHGDGAAEVLNTTLRELLTRPRGFHRVLAAILAIGLCTNLFLHGAQPYAVGLFQAPWDKVAHASLFFALASLAWLITGARHGLFIVVACALIGMADEWKQLSLPGRTAGFDDLAFDLLGAVAAVGLLSTVRRRLMRGETGEPPSGGRT